MSNQTHDHKWTGDGREYMLCDGKTKWWGQCLNQAM